MEDYRRLIELLLPTFLRRPKLLALLNALLGTPLQELNSEYSIWIEQTRYDAAITPQVCSLRYAIELKYDVHCDIIELEGRPYDYLIELDRSADYNSIHNFLKSYGPAGKTFLFGLGDTVFEATWTDFVEYDEVTTYEVEWTNYEEQDDGIVKVDLFFYYVPKPEEKKLYYNIEVKADGPMSDITIGILTYMEKALPAFTTWKEHILSPMGEAEMIVAQDVSEEEFSRDVYAVIKEVEGVTPKRRYILEHIYYVQPDQLNLKQ